MRKLPPFTGVFHPAWSRGANPLGEGAMIDFAITPNVGTTISLDQQVYELRGLRPTSRVDGSPTTLLDWETECPTCKEPFTVTTGLKTKSINRRCSSCAKPFKPVKGKRSRKVKVMVQHA